MSSTISRAMLKNSAAPRPTAAEGRAGTEREPAIKIRKKQRSSTSGALFKWTLGIGILAVGGGYFIAAPWQASRPVPPPAELAIAPPPADATPALPVIAAANFGGGPLNAGSNAIEAPLEPTPVVIRIEIAPQPAVPPPVVRVATPRPPAPLVPPPVLPPAIPPALTEVAAADAATSPSTGAGTVEASPARRTDVQLRTSAAQVMEKYKVSGIFWSPVDPVAFINDTIVEVGQTFDEITLLRVEKTYIVVEYHGTEVTLRP